MDEDSPWFRISTSKEIMESWEYGENCSIRLTYKKKDKSGNEEVESYEYQEQ